VSGRNRRDPHIEDCLLAAFSYQDFALGFLLVECRERTIIPKTALIRELPLHHASLAARKVN
jgi:hypothetical protein